MHDGVHQQALRIDEDVTLLALDLSATSSLSLLASVVPRRIAGPPFLSCADRCALAFDAGDAT